ncbi:MAG: hypothetical protein ABJ375_01870 [Rhizobiaceae bacterium]
MSDDLQLDMAAGLVFAMILIYQIFMDEAREPSEPAPDSVKITVLFREAPNYRGMDWPWTKDPTRWSNLGDELEDWEENIEDPVYRLNRVRRTVKFHGYPETGSGAWGCRFSSSAFNFMEMPRYQITPTSLDPDLIDFRERINDDEQVVIGHSLERFQSDFSGTSDPSQQAEVWDAKVANFFPGLKSIEGAEASLWRSPLKVLHCRANENFSEQQRKKISIQFFEESGPARSCGTNQQPMPYDEKEDLLASASNLRTTDSEESIPNSIQEFFAANPSSFNPDQQRLADAVLSALWPFKEFGVFSCQATGVGVAKADNINLRIEDARRDIQIMAVSIQSRSRPEETIWHAWNDEVEFPGRLSRPLNTTLEAIKVDSALGIEFGL